MEKMLLKKRLEETEHGIISKQVHEMIENLRSRSSSHQQEVKETARDPRIAILDKLRSLETILVGHKDLLSRMTEDLQGIINSHQLDETIVG